MVWVMIMLGVPVVVGFGFAPLCPRRPARRQLRMDDEVARPGIKVELTTRDEYMEQRFTRLSESGHDLTRLLPEELAQLKQQTTNAISAQHSGLGIKGLYVATYGGLPMFASGDRLDVLCTPSELFFSAPCDPEHIRVVTRNNPHAHGEFYCIRSAEKIGDVLTDSTGKKTHYRVTVKEGTLRFYSLDKPFPIESQPESYWGSEDQYSFRRQIGGEHYPESK